MSHIKTGPDTPARSCAAALAIAAAAALPATASAQLGKSFFVPGAQLEPLAAVAALPCKGKTTQVSDGAFEGVKTTTWNYAAAGGGGVGGRFDPVPVLTVPVT